MHEFPADFAAIASCNHCSICIALLTERGDSPNCQCEARYRRLIEILVRYRAVLGMPRQEELLQILSSKLTLEETEELFINLCPYVYRTEQD